MHVQIVRKTGNGSRNKSKIWLHRLAVTENPGVINVFRSGEHNHPIQQISNCVYWRKIMNELLLFLVLQSLPLDMDRMKYDGYWVELISCWSDQNEPINYLNQFWMMHIGLLIPLFNRQFLPFHKQNVQPINVPIPIFSSNLPHTTSPIIYGT